MKKQGEQPYFVMVLDSYAVPAYCSDTTEYLGTLDMMGDYIDALLMNEARHKEFATSESKHSQNIARAYQEYRAGNGNAEAYIAWANRTLITPTTVYHRCKVHKSNVEFIYENMWKCPYYIEADEVEAELIYVGHEGKYKRFVKVAVSNMRYDTEEIGRNKIKLQGEFWGQPSMLHTDKNVTHNRLLFCDQWFENKSTMQKDIERPSEIRYEGLMADVFGDG